LFSLSPVLNNEVVLKLLVSLQNRLMKEYFVPSSNFKTTSIQIRFSMKKRTYTLLPLSILIFLCQSISAQVATISDEIQMRGDDNFEIIGQVERQLFVLKDISEGAKIYSFDPNMKLNWENDVQCEKKNFKVLGTMARPDYLGVIIQYKVKGNNVVQFQKIDEAGAIIDSMVIKNYERRSFSPKPVVISSVDKTKFVLFNDKEDNVIEATSFDTEKMQIIWDETLRINELSLRNELYQMMVSNSGSFYVVMYKEYSKSQREKNQFTIFELSTIKKSISQVSMESNFLYDVYFNYDDLHKNIVAAGLYDDKKLYRASGCFFLKMKPGNDESKVLNFEKFPDELMSTIRGKESDENDNFSEAYVNDLILKSDGGVVMVIERFKKMSQSFSTNLPRTVQGQSRTITSMSQAEYHYDDIIIVNLDAEGKSNWRDVLYKRQFSRDDGGRLSSFFIMKTPKMVRFVYNDEIQHDNKISEYNLLRTGESERNAVLDTDGYNISMMFKDGIQTAKNEIIIPSLERRSLKLVRIKYGN
jgi:hypothetical protein